MTDTATTNTLATAGKVIANRDGVIVFAPANTNYELKLAAPNYTGPMNRLIQAVIRVKARKVLTVPSGGNFISPIFGPPHIIQGRVRALDRRMLILQAGAIFQVELPDDDIVYDLASGPIEVGKMVNVTAWPGAVLERSK